MKLLLNHEALVLTSLLLGLRLIAASKIYLDVVFVALSGQLVRPELIHALES